MKDQPWYCTGDGNISHPRTENYGDICSFESCTNRRPKTRKIPPWLYWTGPAVIACVGILGLRVFLRPPPPDQSKFFYGGATTFAPVRSEAREKAIESILAQKMKDKNFDLTYVEPPSQGVKPGSGTGIQMLIEGQLSFSQSSRPFRTEELEEARVRGFDLQQIPVAIDGIAVYVNPELKIASLTLNQLRDLFTGKITNWRQLNGPNLPVVPISLSSQANETADFFQKEVMARQDFAPRNQEVRDPTAAIRKVGSIPGAIGYTSAALVCNQLIVKTVALASQLAEGAVEPCLDRQVNVSTFANGSYPIIRRLFIIVRQDGSIEEKAGQAYAEMLLSNEGQKLLEEAGFARIVGQ